MRGFWLLATVRPIRLQHQVRSSVCIILPLVVKCIFCPKAIPMNHISIRH